MRAKNSEEDLMTLGEIQTERGKLLVKFMAGNSSVRDCRRFLFLNGLVAMFEETNRVARGLHDRAKKMSMGR